jgi:Sad1 / UNC-like C-terminal
MQDIFLVLSILLACSVHASVTSASSAQATPGTANSNATCQSKTVNYITHGLPQQCFTSSWKSTCTTATANATDDAVSNSLASPTFASNVTQAPAQGIVDGTATSEEATSSAAESGADAASAIQTASLSSTSTLASPPTDADEPSPLEDEKFMSFEEWKKQNLQKMGQSEQVGRDSKSDQQIPRKRPTNIHTALDSLGDDAEIDLDFSGFIPGGPDLASPAPKSPQQDTEVLDSLDNTPPNLGQRSKDAGTTCKERYNYASFDCAANVLKYNAEAITASAVLGENKDSYMLNVCSVDNKFLIVELCNDLSIDTIVLANFEFFSSTFRTFRVSVSDKYPVKLDKWKTLGTFEARNTREVQAFLVDNPAIWARYLRIEFLTHYGSEYYCPVSLVRVHGITMMEEYKHELEKLQANDEEEVEQREAIEAAGETFVPEAVADQLLDERQREGEGSKQETSTATSTQTADDPPDTININLSDSPSPAPNNLDVESSRRGSVSTSVAATTDLPRVHIEDTCPTTPSQEQPEAPIQTKKSISAQAESRDESTLSHAQSNIATVEHDEHKTNSSALSHIGNSNSTTIPSRKQNSTEASRNVTDTTASERQKTSPSATQSHAAAPTMQESFFKSVQKRLQMLEANSSLSLQYIEDQSRALRDAFNKVEQRQLAKTTTFLDYLNTTVLSELRDFRQQYDQLWQSTVIELETQRERSRQETAAINARLGILADELIFHKRISILQMVLILICLGIVLFTKGSLNQYLEIPVVQRVLSRSPSSRWLNVATLDTPTQSPPPTRESSFRKRQGILKGHRRMPSEDSIEGSLSPSEMYSPPTPTSIGDASDGELIKQEKRLDNPEFDPSTIERPRTSPPILPGSDSPSTPELDGISGHGSIKSRSMNSSPERGADVPKLVVEEATPPSKRLTWSLPGG